MAESPRVQFRLPAEVFEWLKAEGKPLGLEPNEYARLLVLQVASQLRGRAGDIERLTTEVASLRADLGKAVADFERALRAIEE